MHDIHIRPGRVLLDAAETMGACLKYQVGATGRLFSSSSRRECCTRDEVVSVMSALALWSGIACTIATGVFYSFAEMRSYGSDWAAHVCQHTPSLCSNPQWFAAAACLMLIFYFIVERFEI
jgi:hypothetical protein